jgi:hypothetical protein
MIAWTVIALGSLIGAALIILLWNLRRAPIGFENEGGFYEGADPQPAAPELILGALVTASGPSVAGDEQGLGSYLDVEPWPSAGRDSQPAIAAGPAPHVPSVR